MFTTHLLLCFDACQRRMTFIQQRMLCVCLLYNLPRAGPHPAGRRVRMGLRLPSALMALDDKAHIGRERVTLTVLIRFRHDKRHVDFCDTISKLQTFYNNIQVWQHRYTVIGKQGICIIRTSCLCFQKQTKIVKRPVLADNYITCLNALTLLKISFSAKPMMTDSVWCALQGLHYINTFII